MRVRGLRQPPVRELYTRHFGMGGDPGAEPPIPRIADSWREIPAVRLIGTKVPRMDFRHQISSELLATCPPGSYPDYCRILATVHGPSFKGDGAQALRQAAKMHAAVLGRAGPQSADGRAQNSLAEMLSLLKTRCHGGFFLLVAPGRHGYWRSEENPAN